MVPDNGPEIICRALEEWTYRHNVQIRFIEPDRPAQKAFIESFNGRFRGDCLNDHWFRNLDCARRIIAAWRTDYNAKRPHSALGYMPPTEFAQAAQNRLYQTEELTRRVASFPGQVTTYLRDNVG